MEVDEADGGNFLKKIGGDKSADGAEQSGDMKSMSGHEEISKDR